MSSYLPSFGSGPFTLLDLLPNPARGRTARRRLPQPPAVGNDRSRWVGKRGRQGEMSESRRRRPCRGSCRAMMHGSGRTRRGRKSRFDHLGWAPRATPPRRSTPTCTAPTTWASGPRSAAWPSQISMKIRSRVRLYHAVEREGGDERRDEVRRRAQQHGNNLRPRRARERIERVRLPQPVGGEGRTDGLSHAPPHTSSETAATAAATRRARESMRDV